MKKDPFSIICSRRLTEKATALANLESAEHNPSVKACRNPKAVFLVAREATKPQIAAAIEQIYGGVTVVKVNTIHRKAKPRRVRGRQGFRASLKKAIVTLAEGDQI